MTVNDTNRQEEIIVIGLGNPIVTDDSVGIHVARLLQKRLSGNAAVKVTEDYRGGLRLMEQLVGYRRAVVIDAICTGAEPGTIHKLRVDSIPTQRNATSHDVNLATALAVGRQAGLKLPNDEDIVIIGIEAEDVVTFGEKCTPKVEAAIPTVVSIVEKLLHSWLTPDAKQ